MTDANQSKNQLNEKINTPLPPIYQKPKTTLFLENAQLIQGGGANPLESQGGGYLTS